MKDLTYGTLTRETMERVVHRSYVATTQGWYVKKNDLIVLYVSLKARKVPFESAAALLDHLIALEMETLPQPIDLERAVPLNLYYEPNS